MDVVVEERNGEDEEQNILDATPSRTTTKCGCNRRCQVHGKPPKRQLSTNQMKIQAWDIMQKYANAPKKSAFGNLINDKLNEINNKGKRLQVETNILKLVNDAIAENDTITTTVAPVIIQSQVPLAGLAGTSSSTSNDVNNSGAHSIYDLDNGQNIFSGFTS